MSKENPKVLVTGVGAIIGYGIIESLRQTDSRCFVLGVDIYKECFGKHISDVFVQVPLTSDPKYISVIQELLQEYEIELIIPGIEQDLYFFSENRDLFDVNIVLNNIDLIQLSKDKYLMFNYLRNLSASYVIPSFLSLDYDSAKSLLGLPFIIKPKKSYASKGFFVIKNEDDYFLAKNSVNEDTIFQPYIGDADSEYTVSVFGDGNGGIVDGLILRRYLSKAGASERAYTVPSDIHLETAVFDLVKIFKPVGPTNFQFRKQHNEVFLLEINPRISSACSIRSKFGYNEPALCVQYYLDNKNCIVLPKKSGSAIRYIADRIVYE